jgi:hypothetical protein
VLEGIGRRWEIRTPDERIQSSLRERVSYNGDSGVARMIEYYKPPRLLCSDHTLLRGMLPRHARHEPRSKAETRR